MFLYLPIKERCYNKAIGYYFSFGIKIYRLTENCCSVEFRISDISISEAFVSNLSLLCTKQQLSPIHFEEIIDDLI